MDKIKIVDFMVHKNAFYENLLNHLYDQNRIDTASNKLLILVDLDIIGENEAVNNWLRTKMEQKGMAAFGDSIAAIIVRSSSEFYTKRFAKKIIWLMNYMGCEWIGHPLVEVTEDYKNFNTWALSINAPRDLIAHQLSVQLIDRLCAYEHLKKKVLEVLVLHASHQKLSNTLTLWEKVKEQLVSLSGKPIHFTTLQVDDGVISDCHGCDFETCSYFGLQKNCFYGGFVVENLYPSFECADFVVMVCPNYNDSISAKLMAVVNRLSALYRNVSLRDKYLLGVVVSANSGNDVVASQIIGALCVNKGLRLTPNFSVYGTANAPGEILTDQSIDAVVKNYSDKLYRFMCKNFTEN